MGETPTSPPPGASEVTTPKVPACHTPPPSSWRSLSLSGHGGQQCTAEFRNVSTFTPALPTLLRGAQTLQLDPSRPLTPLAHSAGPFQVHSASTLGP